MRGATFAWLSTSPAVPVRWDLGHAGWSMEHAPDAASASAALPGVRLYGMFAHGELGPSAFAGFAGADTPAQPCTQHSMHTVLAVHTTASMKEEV